MGNLEDAVSAGWMLYVYKFNFKQILKKGIGEKVKYTNVQLLIIKYSFYVMKLKGNF